MTITQGDYSNIENLDNSHISVPPYSPITKNTFTYLRSIPILTEEERDKRSGMGMSFNSYLQLDPDVDSELETPRDNDPRENF